MPQLFSSDPEGEDKEATRNCSRRLRQTKGPSICRNFSHNTLVIILKSPPKMGLIHYFLYMQMHIQPCPLIAHDHPKHTSTCYDVSNCDLLFSERHFFGKYPLYSPCFMACNKVSTDTVNLKCFFFFFADIYQVAESGSVQ